MTDLDKIIELQREMLSDLTDLKTGFLAKPHSEKTRGYLEILSNELDFQYQQFKDQHKEITNIIRETSLPVESVPYMAEKCNAIFRDIYFSLKGMVADCMPHDETSRSPFSSTFTTRNNPFASHSTPGNLTASMDVRLPKISLPQFTGDYIEWVAFRNIYMSLVHENPSLSKVQKFYYLKGTLSGEAANLIRTISASEANYDSAWNILNARYHNRRIIVETLIAKLFNVRKSDGNFQSIKLIHDNTQECLSSLGNLNIDTSTWDPLIIYIITEKLDLQNRREWERYMKASTEVPKCSDMFSFLEQTFRMLESLSYSQPSSSNSSQKLMNNNFKQKKISSHLGSVSQANSICLFCERHHNLSKCYKFLALSLNLKNDFLTQKNICRNCLSSGHNSDNCPSLFRCGTCKQRHHTVLHVENAISTQTASFNATTPYTPNNSLNTPVVFRNVLLYTIRLFVRTNRGMFPLRALLDPGSQGSLISENCVQLLGLQKQKSSCKVIGVGVGNENLSRFCVKIDLWSRKSKPILSCSALVLSSISSYTPGPISRSLSLPKLDEDLADPFYFDTDPIDLILGSDVCSKIKIPTESFVHGDLFFQNTTFGWVFSGSSEPISTNIVHIHHVNLENILRSFWEQEEVSDRRDLTKEEIACENYFKATTKRTSSGRYIVKLPFKSQIDNGSFPDLHNNLNGAFKRFTQLENSFLKRPLFAETYKDFMTEYESLGHMSKVGIYPTNVIPNSYFLPHHGVFKEDSTTTKLRVVFDGSSHIDGRTSLNEELAPGPALQNDLPQIMTRWRKHKIAFSADIEKMFRQIDVCPSHRPFQQILWRSSPVDELSVYQLNTVTYGTTSAPYLSIRVLQQLAEDHESEFPSESRVLISDSYVDDIISGADSLENAIVLQKNLCLLLKNGCCNLRKWITNSPSLLKEIPEENREKSLTLSFDRDNIVKTLGIQWNTTNDTFTFKVNVNKDRQVSKRSILSETARLYDPLGWLVPSTVIAKSIFKQLWEVGVDWDSPIPSDIERRWRKYRDLLPKFSNLQIPRWIRCSNDFKLELHCFCDASTTAYAAAIYARVLTSNDIFVNLLQAKSKVSPIKTVSIPRLELCAAVLLVKLAKKVKESFIDTPIDNIYFWSDSFTVHSWIRKPSSHWVVYVANRVAEIQRFSNPVQWKYVPSALNPADCASRGLLPNELLEHHEWWYGPHFLYESPSEWPKPLANMETSEEKKSKQSHAETSLLQDEISSNSVSNNLDPQITSSTPNQNEEHSSPYPYFLLRTSSLSKLLKAISLCFRFIHNVQYHHKNPELKEFGTLRMSILNQTLVTLIKVTQAIDFHDDIKMLVSKGEAKHDALLRLMAFIDEDGIVRVGGRLQNSDLPYNVKHPILLSKSNPLSKLIILDSHEKTLHGGLTLTMSYVNRKYWIISGNQLAKNVIGNCMRCFKYYAKASGQIMGNLPSVRLNVTRPFKHSGVDYAGPIPIKNSTLRSATTSKGYICLFVCMVTKAVHLEAVCDLTTNAFLAAFRRFVSRRGACTDIYSDCGTNFVGASKELQVLYNRSKKSLPEDLRHNLLSNGTDWHFIPPASPNFGGLWEAGVKSVKYHLKRLMNEKVLTFEELSTLLCQIEGCLNSRPLCPLSSDPSALDALTPAHFLIGEPTNCIQEETLLDLNINHLSRWKAVEKLKQHFWKRWYSEYLNRLQSRPKWLKAKRDAQIGDLVLIADDRCGPGQWHLGRVHEVHPGTDGKVRVVSVFSKYKITKRPISKICFLPIDSTNDDSSPTHDAMSMDKKIEPVPDAVSRSTAKSVD